MYSGGHQALDHRQQMEPVIIGICWIVWGSIFFSQAIHARFGNNDGDIW